MSPTSDAHALQPHPQPFRGNAPLAAA